MTIIKRKDNGLSFLPTFGEKTVKAASVDYCFLIADVDIIAYAFVVVAVVLAAATVAAAPSLHAASNVARDFASVDDVIVSIRN